MRVQLLFSISLLVFASLVLPAMTEGTRPHVEELRQLAESGVVKAQTKLELMYNIGHGVLQDYKEGGKWYHKAAEQGSDKAQ